MITALAKPDIVAVLEREGIELKQKGLNFWAGCPLHSERTPSFCVDSKRQLFKCFSCGEYGDVIDFIMKFKSLPFNGAISYLGISDMYTPIIKNPQETRRHELVIKFSRWCGNYSKLLCEMLRLCNQIVLQVKTPENFELTGLEEVCLQKEIYAHQLSILSSNDDETKFRLFKEVMGYD